MSSRTLLVLGASIYQMATIRRARELGYRVLSADNVAHNPGHVHASKSFLVDIVDRDAVLQLARRERVDGIVAPCTDAGVPTASFVAQALGLPAPPLRASEIAVSKSSFRRFQRERGEPSPECLVGDERLEIARSEFAAGPWIVKPDASSGSKGVFIVRSPQELRARLQQALAFSRSGRVVAERFLEGRQGTCEGILKDGRIAAAWLLDRQTAAPPYVATHGHFVPTSLDLPAQRAVLARIESAWAKLGVRSGLFDCDFVLSEGTVFVLELSPRLGGNSIARLLQFAAGFDPLEYIIRCACGEPCPLPDPRLTRACAIVLLGTPQRGVLRYDLGELQRLREEPWVAWLEIDIPAGAPVEPFINGRHRVGEALVVADDRGQLESRVGELKARLALGAEPGNRPA
ncbi:MAG: ATP-grasp domain-containing protein [Burkholderiales bacterium]